eukprot:TRINITY_DN54911_c0_g1_i1.p1 TRINITY_DN54911_c0_g1~~TRINITY_DN54911_c0_g1_i1.p1  ORF type:complete len:781 (+),score=108.14 TRINITY_DN54911_c0_g1_i1:281-2623(+)
MTQERADVRRRGKRVDSPKLQQTVVHVAAKRRSSRPATNAQQAAFEQPASTNANNEGHGMPSGVRRGGAALSAVGQVTPVQDIEPKQELGSPSSLAKQEPELTPAKEKAGDYAPSIAVEEPSRFRLMHIIRSVSLIHIVAVAVILLLFCSVLETYSIMHPVFADVDASGRPIVKHGSAFQRGDALHAKLWINKKASVPWHAPFAEIKMKYDWETFGLKTERVNITVTQEEFRTLQNTSLYAEVLHAASGKTARAYTSVLKSLPKPTPEVKYSLLTQSVCPEHEEPSFGHGRIARGVSEIQMYLVFDTTQYPDSVTHGPYVPRLFVDEFWLTPNQLVTLNATGANTFELSVHLGLMSPERRHLRRHLESALNEQAKFLGENSQELLQVRDLFANTNPVLVAITIVASVIHIVFDVLAFESDVMFRRSCDSEALNKFVSVKSLLATILTQTMVLLYLCDENANKLLVASIVVAILVDVWKMQRAMCVKIVHVFGLPLPTLNSKVHREKRDDFDGLAMKWLMLIFAPLVVGYGTYTLHFHCHRSWYSYFLAVSASFAYSIGFIWMTPQLFINYKYKTVAYMTWKKLIYRAISTFIDDLFALIIRMPTLHGIACLRDDVVFFVYLWQRYCYRVDKSRTFDEDGYELKDEREATDSKNTSNDRACTNVAAPVVPCIVASAPVVASVVSTIGSGRSSFADDSDGSTVATTSLFERVRGRPSGESRGGSYAASPARSFAGDSDGSTSAAVTTVGRCSGRHSGRGRGRSRVASPALIANKRKRAQNTH